MFKRHLKLYLTKTKFSLFLNYSPSPPQYILTTMHSVAQRENQGATLDSPLSLSIHPHSSASLADTASKEHPSVLSVPIATTLIQANISLTRPLRWPTCPLLKFPKVFFLSSGSQSNLSKAQIWLCVLLLRMKSKLPRQPPRPRMACLASSLILSPATLAPAAVFQPHWASLSCLFSEHPKLWTASGF